MTFWKEFLLSPCPTLSPHPNITLKLNITWKHKRNHDQKQDLRHIHTRKDMRISNRILRTDTHEKKPEQMQTRTRRRMTIQTWV